VVVPHLADQFFWASQVARLGVGTGTRSRVSLSSQRLALALESVLDQPVVRACVSSVNIEMAAEDGVAEALKAIV